MSFPLLPDAHTSLGTFVCDLFWCQEAFSAFSSVKLMLYVVSRIISPCFSRELDFTSWWMTLILSLSKYHPVNICQYVKPPLLLFYDHFCLNVRLLQYSIEVFYTNKIYVGQTCKKYSFILSDLLAASWLSWKLWCREDIRHLLIRCHPCTAGEMHCLFVDCVSTPSFPKVITSYLMCHMLILLGNILESYKVHFFVSF